MTDRTSGQPTYTLRGPDNKPCRSGTPGTLGGHRRGKLYGLLDCPSALCAMARGRYVRYRVFFADEGTAIAAGYRPCAVCLPAKYQRWKAAHKSRKGSTS
ncbi:metal-binding protein [Streptomyces sp. R41]|uniref:Metal-binding protein n=1 Tax=Streptomyces sp. R41 TaxID=3238632 RepID=A0AB39RXT4_9ACTN